MVLNIELLRIHLFIQCENIKMISATTRKENIQFEIRKIVGT